MTAARQRAEMIGALHSAQQRVAADGEAWKRVIGSRFAAGETDWDAPRSAATWLERLDAFGEPGLSASMRRELETGQRAWPAIAAVGLACDRMGDALDDFTGLFESDRLRELNQLGDQRPLAAVDALCDTLAARVDELRDWTEWREWRERAREHGWDSFVTALITARVDATQVLASFQRAYWNRRLEALFADEPELAEDLRGGAFQRWVDEFCELDRKLVRTGADRLIARRESTRTSHVSSPGSEIDLLRREARKMRRHLPVRVLLSRIPGLLSELKPCLMMSPLTVSHFLSPDHAFDLVVFDEASQVPPQDAINCIYRGAQLVVAGDSKQLPPTPFFQIAELDEIAPEEEDARTEEDMESVLDACDALLPSHALRWHYRSRAEPLIAFSNRHIYDGSLVTFPSAERRSQRMGIGFVHVPDGIYDRGAARATGVRRRSSPSASCTTCSTGPAARWA